MRTIAIALAAASFSAGGNEVMIPHPTEVFMGNGMKALLLTKEDSPLVTTLVRFYSGSRSDPPGKEGLTEVCARMLARGTKTQSAAKIAVAIDKLGGALDLDADHESIDLFLELRLQDHEKGLKLLSTLISESTFPDDEIELVIDQMVSEIRAIKESPSATAQLKFRNILYRGRGYGRPVLGTETSLKRLSPGDIRDHARKLFVPQNSILIAAGPLRRVEPIQWIHASFGSWQEEGPRVRTEEAAQKFEGPAVVLIDRPEFSQVDLLIGYPGVSAKSPDRFALRLASLILGGATSSRLFQKLRAEDGLSYDLGSSMAIRHHAGEILIAGATRKESAVDLIRGIDKTISQLRDDPPSTQELARAKALIRTDLAGLTETSDHLAIFAAELAQLDLDSSHLEETHRMIEAVDTDAIRRVVRKYFDLKRRLIVLVGPVAGLREAVRPLGRIAQ